VSHIPDGIICRLLGKLLKIYRVRKPVSSSSSEMISEGIGMVDIRE
jgi:hypothetical protein